jgi:hypothetical protein
MSSNQTDDEKAECQTPSGFAWKERYTYTGKRHNTDEEMTSVARVQADLTLCVYDLRCPWYNPYHTVIYKTYGDWIEACRKICAR